MLSKPGMISNPPKVACIVLCYNHIDLTLGCLESLVLQDYTRLEIYIVDNASQDGTVEVVQKTFPQVKIIALQENLGYVGGNNRGIQAALQDQADYVFLVNNDTLLDSNCVSGLVEVFEENPKVGITGPMVYTFDPGNIISSAGGQVDWDKANSINVGAGEVDQQQYHGRQVDFINGCGLMISRAAIEKVGLLDEKYFMYWEETDWCARVKRAGLEVVFSPQVTMRHKAPIHSDELSPTTLYYLARNRLRFFAIHTPWPQKPLTLAHAVHGILRSIQDLKRENRQSYARAAQTALWHALSGKWGYKKPSW